MSMQDERDGSLSSEEEAKLQAFRRIASALERGNIDELAAALREEPDPSATCAGEPRAAERKMTVLWTGLRPNNVTQPSRQP
jgi:hypothetical protein